MTPRTSVRAQTRVLYSTMPGRELALGLAPERGQGAVRKVDLVLPDNRLAQEPPLPNPLPEGERGQSEFGESTAQENAPTPDPSPLLGDARGGGEKEESGGVEKKGPNLMSRVRSLYEDTAVPVREIARLAGVTERTLYKYVERGGWRRRYAAKPRGDAAAAGNRGRRWQRASGHEGVKGAGGRFIARAEAERDVAHGLKALDPDGAARAAIACAAAELRHSKAASKARSAQAWDARCRALDAVSSAMEVYNRFRITRSSARSPAERAHDETMEALFVQQIETAVRALSGLKG